jgi:hypothetical protein
MVNPNRFYTYAYLRGDRTPYYIGKGEKDRIYKKKKNEIQPPKNKSRIIFLKRNLTEDEAFKHEIYIISVLGRKDLGTGILRNRTNGGEGGSGSIRSDETKKKIGDSLRGKPHLPHTGETRKKMRKYAGNRPKEHNKKISESNKGKPAHNKGKKMSDEQKLKLKLANTGKVHTEETKLKIALKSRGKKHTEETKEKLRQLSTGRKHNEETKLYLSEINKNKKWWNNGMGSVKFSKECPGDEWTLGRKRTLNEVA